MELRELKKQHVRADLGIDAEFGGILTVIDFGNVNFWFDEDRQNAEHQAMPEDEKLRINLSSLYDFCGLFSEHIRFYYGHDAQKRESIAFITAARHIFGKRVFTKPIQKVRHHLSAEEIGSNKRSTFVDKEGLYVHLPKCNFDVEISVDAIRLLEQYDTLAMFSGDSDFASLVRYLKRNGKKVILFKAGFIASDLRDAADKVISAQNIKRHIAQVVKKQKPGFKPGLANR